MRTEGAAALTASTLVSNVPFAQSTAGIVTIVLVTALNVAMMLGAAVYFARKYRRRKLKKDDKYALANETSIQLLFLSEQFVSRHFVLLFEAGKLIKISRMIFSNFSCRHSDYMYKPANNVENPTSKWSFLTGGIANRTFSSLGSKLSSGTESTQASVHAPLSPSPSDSSGSSMRSSTLSNTSSLSSLSTAHLF